MTALFARYAFPPNELGYCGPPDASVLLHGDYPVGLAAHARDAALVVATHDLSMLDAVHRVLRLADGRQTPG